MDKIQENCKHSCLRIINSFQIECFNCGLEWDRDNLDDLLIVEDEYYKDKVIE